VEETAATLPKRNGGTQVITLATLAQQIQNTNKQLNQRLSELTRRSKPDVGSNEAVSKRSRSDSAGYGGMPLAPARQEQAAAPQEVAAGAQQPPLWNRSHFINRASAKGPEASSGDDHFKARKIADALFVKPATIS
jgi:hypothetical protein